jgi:hypothetical protein
MRNCRTIYAAHVRPAYSARMSVPRCYPSTPVTYRLSRPSSFVRLFFDRGFFCAKPPLAELTPICVPGSAHLFSGAPFCAFPVPKFSKRTSGQSDPYETASLIDQRNIFARPPSFVRLSVCALPAPMHACISTDNPAHQLRYSVSKPLLVNFSVRLFSVTVRTTLSGAPSGISASISRVTRTDDPTRPTR